MVLILKKIHHTFHGKIKFRIPVFFPDSDKSYSNVFCKDFCECTSEMKIKHDTNRVVVVTRYYSYYTCYLYYNMIIFSVFEGYNYRTLDSGLQLLSLSNLIFFLDLHFSTLLLVFQFNIFKSASFSVLYEVMSLVSPSVQSCPRF